MAEGVVYLVVNQDGSLHANRTVTTVKYDQVVVIYFQIEITASGY